jgi:hypothetical protein
MKLLNLLSVCVLSLMATLVYAQPKTSLVFNASEENSLVDCGLITEDYSSFTIETWVNLTSFDNDNYIICCEGWDDGECGFVLRISNSLPQLTMGSVSNGWQNVNGTTTLELDQWYHIAVSFDTMELKMYVNGELESTVQPGSGLNKSIYNLVLGEIII